MLIGYMWVLAFLLFQFLRSFLFLLPTPPPSSGSLFFSDTRVASGKRL
jgi:hypothetical protein